MCNFKQNFLIISIVYSIHPGCSENEQTPHCVKFFSWLLYYILLMSKKPTPPPSYFVCATSLLLLFTYMYIIVNSSYYVQCLAYSNYCMGPFILILNPATMEKPWQNNNNSSNNTMCMCVAEEGLAIVDNIFRKYVCL